MVFSPISRANIKKWSTKPFQPPPLIDTTIAKNNKKHWSLLVPPWMTEKEKKTYSLFLVCEDMIIIIEKVLLLFEK